MALEPDKGSCRQWDAVQPTRSVLDVRYVPILPRDPANGDYVRNVPETTGCVQQN